MWNAGEMGDLDGRNVLITGANTGIGFATVRVLAGRGARIWIAGRSDAKTRDAMRRVIDETQNTALHYLPLDLGSLSSVRACADAFLVADEPLHVLINNAGLAGQRGTTDSGFELAFGTNHVGPFLLTARLLDRIRESAPARIVTVASDAHFAAKGIDYELVRKRTRNRTGFPEYAVSKLANVLHSQELDRRLEGTGVTTYALHPGVIASDIWRKVPWPVRSLMKLRMRSPEEGAKTSLYCATDPSLANESGHYYEDEARKDPSQVATPELAAELWDQTENWVGS
jgi:NAD(P)-dependent dehydrogenase (short-subunit alcohol dehydrogenase family)